MKKWTTGLGLVFAGLSIFGQTTLHVLPAEVEDLTNSHQLVWETEPGVRYELQQSSNLTSWASIAGYPTSAVQYTDGHAFEMDGEQKQQFYRVVQFDEQPPAITQQFPEDGGFAVPRFGTLSMTLGDLSDLNTNTLSITVGDLGTFSLASD